MRISDWSSDVCSSDLHLAAEVLDNAMDEAVAGHATRIEVTLEPGNRLTIIDNGRGIPVDPHPKYPDKRSEEHTSELQSLMRISYAVFCLKKKTLRIKLPGAERNGARTQFLRIRPNRDDGETAIENHTRTAHNKH